VAVGDVGNGGFQLPTSSIAIPINAVASYTCVMLRRAQKTMTEQFLQGRHRHAGVDMRVARGAGLLIASA